MGLLRAMWERRQNGSQQPPFNAKSTLEWGYRGDAERGLKAPWSGATSKGGNEDLESFLCGGQRTVQRKCTLDVNNGGVRSGDDLVPLILCCGFQFLLGLAGLGGDGHKCVLI